MVIVSATAEESASGAGPYDDVVIVAVNGAYRFGTHGRDSLGDGVELWWCEAFWSDGEDGDTLVSATITLPPKLNAGTRWGGDGRRLGRAFRG